MPEADDRRYSQVRSRYGAGFDESEAKDLVLVSNLLENEIFSYCGSKDCWFGFQFYWVGLIFGVQWFCVVVQRCWGFDFLSTEGGGVIDFDCWKFLVMSEFFGLAEWPKLGVKMGWF